MNITDLIYVFVGSGLGGACRFAVSRWVQGLMATSVFPWGTLVVNVAGCFLIGLFYGLIDKGALPGAHLRLMATVGFCGGFTTFSTFINENMLLFGAQNPHMQIINVSLVALYTVLSLVLGFATLYVGRSIAG